MMRNRLAEIFEDADYDQGETLLRLPVSAVITDHDGSKAKITVPTFDPSLQIPVDYQHDQLDDGTGVLAVQDENAKWYILSP